MLKLLGFFLPSVRSSAPGGSHQQSLKYQWHGRHGSVAALKGFRPPLAYCLRLRNWKPLVSVMSFWENRPTHSHLQSYASCCSVPPQSTSLEPRDRSHRPSSLPQGHRGDHSGTDLHSTRHHPGSGTLRSRGPVRCTTPRCSCRHRCVWCGPSRAHGPYLRQILGRASWECRRNFALSQATPLSHVLRAIGPVLRKNMMDTPDSKTWVRWMIHGNPLYLSLIPRGILNVPVGLKTQPSW